MLPFGTHTALGGAPWTLATVLRYPPERFVSWFTYHCMRAGRIPDQNMFLHYLNNEANRNRAVKTLAAAPLDRPADTAPLALALERLAQFDAVVDFKRVQTLIDHIIDALDLPPVIQARLNVTTPRFAFDATLFAPEIEEVNALDAALYERAQGQLRLPQATRSKAPPPYTVIMSLLNDEESGQLLGDARLIETSRAQAARDSGQLADNKGSRALFDQAAATSPDLMRWQIGQIQRPAFP